METINVELSSLKYKDHILMACLCPFLYQISAKLQLSPLNFVTIFNFIPHALKLTRHLYSTNTRLDLKEKITRLGKEALINQILMIKGPKYRDNPQLRPGEEVDKS